MEKGKLLFNGLEISTIIPLDIQEFMRESVKGVLEKITVELNSDFGFHYSSLDIYINGNYDQSIDMPIGYSNYQINAYENDS